MERKAVVELAYQFGEVYIEVKYIPMFTPEYARANGLEEGHRCGYVTISRDNGDGTFKEYGDEYEVHGGVTYNHTNGGTATLGFDCAHWGDTLETCTLEYVRKEAEQLAIQMLGGVRNG